MGGVARKCDEEDPFLQEQLINMPLRHSLFQPEHHGVFFLGFFLTLLTQFN